MQLSHARPPLQPVPSTSADRAALRTSDYIALVALVLAIIAMPMVFDLAVALDLVH